MYSKLRVLMLLAMGIILAGCIETKKEVTLNPDGSGKMVVNIKQPLDAMMGMNFGNVKAKKKDPKTKAKEEVSKMLEDSPGVDAWEKVSYKIDDADNLIFNGTAYFKSFNDVKIGGSVKSSKNTKLTIGKKTMTLNWTKDKKKGMSPQPQAVKLSDAELKKRIKKGKAQMKQMSGMMGAMLNGFKDKVIYHLPGKITKSNNFKKVNDSTVSLTVDGAKIMKVINDFGQDDKAMAEAIKAGRNLQQDGPSDDYFNEKLFGNKGPILAKVTLDKKAKFNYKAAVKKAKAGQTAMFQKLGLKAPPQPVELPKVSGPVAGTINGEPFKMEKAYIQNKILHLRQGRDFFADKEIIIFMFLKDGEKLDGKKFNISPKTGFSAPHIHMKYKVPGGRKLGKTETFMDKYTMTLEFGKEKNGVITGKISAVLPAKKKSQFSGNFAATMKK